MAEGFQVAIIDNFHAPGDDACGDGHSFATYEEAVAYCKQIVDDFLASAFEPGMSAEELWDQYAMFGEDPFVVGADERFSGWDYAERRCAEICVQRTGHG